MLHQKTYTCGICKTTPDQISHHKSHIETQKHQDKRELFEFKLNKLSNEELVETYKTANIHDIINETETIIYTPIDKANLLINNKKLKTNIFNYSDYINQEQMSDTQKEVMKLNIENETKSISNKEALKDKIHEIHNYLRNNGAGYGMNALKVFNIFYGLKKIEEHNLLDKINLTKPDCAFSYLLDLSNKLEDEKFAEFIDKNVLESIYQSEIKELLFYEIPRHNIKSHVYAYIIKVINEITIIEKTCNVLLSGKIYEYFIGRDESAISELGAYFTDRHIVDYILKKLNPSINPDGTISSMIDMFGGSGGFTTGYINYLNKNYPQLINWNTEINKISHFDMNEDVIKSAGLEFFCLTGVLPNMNNLKYKNSFTDDFNGQKYKYPLTNPPYGGDKTSKTEAQSKREKVKEYIKKELLTITDKGVRIKRQKQLKNIEAQEKQEKKESDKAKVSVSMCSTRIQKFAKDNGLKGNDKESCSLMLLMDILEVGGTAIGVLKEGVFFNKTYKDLRKCLVENFNVREVISVPQDQFENTSTKTSIVIFDNTEEKTTEVKFSDLVVERYTEDKFAEVFGDIVIIENKNDIVGVSDTLISQATKEEILGNGISSLNGKDYNKKEIIVGQGYELVNISSVCEFKKGKQLSKQNFIDGIYPVIGGGVKPTGYHNDFNMKENTILCSSSGENAGYISRYSSKVWASDCFAILPTNINSDYLYYILNGLQKDIFDIQTGSAQPHIYSKDLETHIKIPVPSQLKIEEWVNKISAPYNEKNTKQTQIKELEIFVQNRIRYIGENEHCDEVELGSLIDTKSGEYITKSKMTSGLYPVYGGGNISNYIDIYNRENDLIINKDGVSFDCVKFERGKFYLNHHGWTLIHKNDDYKKYINYWLFNNQLQIYNLSIGSAQKGVNKEKFLKLKIKIPKNKQLIQELETTFQQIETLKNDVKLADELYKQLIQELSKEAIPTKITPVLSQNIAETQEEIEIVPKKKVTKKIIKKPKVLIIED